MTRYSRYSIYCARLCATSLLLLSGSAHAVFFDISGEVTSCNALACNAAEIAIGDPISGFIEVADVAAGPNSTFTQADILSFQLTVGNLDSGPGAGEFGLATLMTDADGEISGGSVAIETSIDTFLGTADLLISLDAAQSSWVVTTDFLGIGEAASGTLNFARRDDPDADGDGVADSVDNCTQIANADQRDSNGDGFGNACDPDLNNDGIVNAQDLGLMRTVFFSTDADADFNGDGVVNAGDLGVLRVFFFGPPGPSGLN